MFALTQNNRCSFIKYILSACAVPGTVLGARETVVRPTDKRTILLNLHFSDRRTSKKKHMQHVQKAGCYREQGKQRTGGHVLSMGFSGRAAEGRGKQAHGGEGEPASGWLGAEHFKRRSCAEGAWLALLKHRRQPEGQERW